MSKLHLNTISSPLGDALVKIMQTSAFNPFYLAGGTALSLQRGHRQSIDIDLFTDIEYGHSTQQDYPMRCTIYLQEYTE